MSSKNIEQRVVQMVFDNASFQRGVEETIQSLANLNNALKLDKSSIDLSGAQKAVNNFSIRGIESQVEAAAASFLSLEHVVDTVFSSISAGAANVLGSLGSALGSLGSNLLTNAIGQIITGGTNRAANIEQAQFMLQGLMKDAYDWKAIEEDLNYAVQDTAFGMDEAAVAAASFAASGVDFGEDMKTALRGISGVAAMTNSSYSEISNIFTTVAGNGRLMGMQLTQLSFKGMNAAATLRDYFNGVNDGSIQATESVTNAIYALTNGAYVAEQDIRDLVSKGDISFEVFAEAMDDTFGEHAKKANETFTGAFANMKAALSRIGADFIMPIHEAARKVFLGLKSIFNNIRSGIRDTEALFYNSRGGLSKGSILDRFTANIEMASNSLSYALEQIASSNIVHDFIVTIAPAISAAFELISKVITGLSQAIFTAFPIMDHDFSLLAYLVQEFARHLQQFGNIISSILGPIVNAFGHLFFAFINTILSGVTTIVPIFSAMLDTFSSDFIVRIANAINSIAETFQKITYSRSFDVENMKKIYESFSKIFEFLMKVASVPFNIIASGVEIVAELFSKFIDVKKSILGLRYTTEVEYIFPFLGKMASIASNFLGEFIDMANKFIDTNLPYFIELIGKAASYAVNFVKEGYKQLAEFISSHIDFDKIIGKVLSFLAKAFIQINDIFGQGNLTEFIQGLTASIDDLPSAAEVFANILPILEAGLDNVKVAAGQAKDFIVSFANSVIQFAGFENFDELIDRIKAFGERLIELKETGSQFLSANNPLDTIREKFENFADFMKNIFGEFDLGRLWNDVIIGVFSGFALQLLVFLTNFLPKVMDKSISLEGILNKFVNGITGFFGNLGKLAKAAGAELIADAILKVAIAMGVLVAALFVLSLIDPAKLESAEYALATIGAVLIALMVAMGIASEKADYRALAGMSAAFVGLGIALAGIAIAFLAFAGAVKILSTIGDPALLAGIAAGLVLLFGGLMAIMGAVSYFAGPSMLAAGAGMMLMSVGLTMMVAPIIIMALLPWDLMLSGIARMAQMLLVLAAGVSLLAYAGIDKVSVGLIAFSASMYILAGAIVKLNSAGEILSDGLITFGIMAAIFIVFVAVLKALSKEAKNMAIASASILIIAAAIGLLTLSLMALSVLNFEHTIALLAMLALSVIAFAAAAAFAGKSIAGAASIFIVATAMVILAAAITILGTVPWQIVLNGIGMLAIALAVLAGAAGLFQLFSKGAIALSITLVALAAALLVGAAGIGVLAFNLALLMTVLPGVKDMLGKIFGTDLEQAIINIALVTAGALLLAIAIAAVGAASLLLLPALLAATAALSIVAAIMGDNFIYAAEQAGAAIEALVSSIEAHMPNIVTKGRLIVLELMHGLEEAMPAFLVAGINLMTSFFNSLAIAINVGREKVLAAFGQVGAAIIAALINTIADGLAQFLGEDNPMVQWMRQGAKNLETAAGEAADAANEEYEKRLVEMGLPVTTEDAIARVKGTFVDNTPELGEVSKDLGELLSTKFGIGIEDLPNLTEGELAEVQEAIDSAGLPIDISNVASQMSSNFGYEISDIPWYAENAAGQVPSKFDSVSTELSAKGETAGYNYDQGLANGLDWYSWLAETAAADVANNLDAAAYAALWSHSPSKKAFMLGMYYDQGLANGVDKYSNLPASSAEDMALGMLGTTAMMVARVSEEMDALNASPTITPVFDTSSVSEGMAVLDAMMMQRQIAMASWANADERYDPVTQSKADNQAQTVYNTYLDYNADSSATDMVRDMTRKFKMVNLLGG